MKPLPRADGGVSVHETPDLELSEDRFPSTGAATVREPEVEAETEAEEAVDVQAAAIEEPAEAEAPSGSDPEGLTPEEEPEQTEQSA
jgi:hypothetical protein